jgi:hypothetical protein
MVRYVVVDTHPDSRLVWLRDDAGRRHVAYCRGILPKLDTAFIGDFPALGLALLMDASGKVCRLVFSQIDCAQSLVSGQVHKVSPHFAHRRPANDLHA